MKVISLWHASQKQLDQFRQDCCRRCANQIFCIAVAKVYVILPPMERVPSFFAIKAEVSNLEAATFEFAAVKTMYGGKNVAVGDRIFVFASENEGGSGLLARGIVTSSVNLPKTAAIRQTPRVSIVIKRTGLAKTPCGRTELREFRNWNDRRPETELNFKLYRQATNKIVGLTDLASDFLNGLF